MENSVKQLTSHVIVLEHQKSSENSKNVQCTNSKTETEKDVAITLQDVKEEETVQLENKEHANLLELSLSPKRNVHVLGIQSPKTVSKEDVVVNVELVLELNAKLTNLNVEVLEKLSVKDGIKTAEFSNTETELLENNVVH